MQTLAVQHERIRVLVASIPRMLSDIVLAALGGDGEIELLLATEDAELIVDVDALKPDVLIAAEIDVALLYDAPRLQIYLLGADAKALRRVELRPVSEDMGEISLAELSVAIKSRWKH